MEEEIKPQPKKRGRPKGSKVGKRAVVWVCAAIIDDELVQERYESPDNLSDEEVRNFSEAEASAMFEEENGTEPTSVIGPFHDFKGASIVAPKKRETVSIAMPSITANRVKAIYNGWNGMAYGIEDRSDVVYFMFGDEVSPNPLKKKNPPTARTIFKSAIQIINA